MLNHMELCLAVGIGTKDSQRIKQESNCFCECTFKTTCLDLNIKADG